MDEAIKQIGERLKGLREVLNIPAVLRRTVCMEQMDLDIRLPDWRLQ